MAHIAQKGEKSEKPCCRAASTASKPPIRQLPKKPSAMMREWEVETTRTNLTMAEVLHRDATYGSTNKQQKA